MFSKTPQKRSSVTTSHCMTPPTEDNNVLDSRARPLHAFPSPYPLVCAHEPFPLESRGQKFPTFQWARHPNFNTPSQSPTTDVNDLVDRFALLSVRDVYSRQSQRNREGMQDSRAATGPITVRPPPAPHPALIKHAKGVPSLARWSPLPTVRASQPTLQVFTRSSILIEPLSHSEDVVSSRRRVSSLPKRCPRQSPLACRNLTPPVSDVSSIPSPCSSLRSLSESFDLGRETSSLVLCSGSLNPHLVSPQPQTCSAA